MDLRQLRLFVALAEEGNFTRAAERVHLSQPALTHRIRGLEDELGVPLFTRTSRGAALTPAGEALLEDARLLLNHAAQSVQRARRAGGLVERAARVGFDFVEFGGVSPMPSLLTAFRERFPEAQLGIQVLRREELERALLDDRLDIAFMLGPPTAGALGFHALLRGTYGLLLPAGHALAGPAPVTRQDLRSERLLLPRLNPVDDAALGAFLHPDGGPQTVEVAALRGLVAAGEGVAVVPSGLLSGLQGPAWAVGHLADAPMWSFGLAWHEARPQPLADLAQRTIRQLVPQAVPV